jgi:CRISPR-associated protein Cas2
MTVIVANDTPDAIRGMLKRWFIEPKPNVFVGTLNTRTHGKVMDYISRNSPKEFGMLIISSQPNCQGYTVERVGPCGCLGRRPEIISGLALVAEDWIEPEDLPF